MSCHFCKKPFGEEEGLYYQGYAKTNQKVNSDVYHEKCIGKLATLVGHTSVPIQVPDCKVRKIRHKVQKKKTQKTRKIISFKNETESFENCDYYRRRSEILLNDLDFSISLNPPKTFSYVIEREHGSQQRLPPRHIWS